MQLNDVQDNLEHFHKKDYIPITMNITLFQYQHQLNQYDHNTKYSKKTLQDSYFKSNFKFLKLIKYPFEMLRIHY